MAEGNIFEFLHPAFQRWRTGSYGGHDGQMSPKWNEILSKDPTGASIVMTIEVVLGDDVIVRVASQPIEVTSSSTGKTYNYMPILGQEPTIERSYQVGNAGSSSRSIAMQFPNRLIDIKSVINSGRILAGVAEISLQVQGGDYDERYVLIRGGIDDGITFGASDDEFISMSASDPKDTSDLRLAPFVVDDTRWPKAHESAVGNRYPVVLNSFTRVPGLLVHSDLTASPAEQRWLVCWGHDVTIAATNAVYVNGTNEYVGSTAADFYNYTVRKYVDGRGVPVTLVDMGNNLPSPGGTLPGTDASIFVEVTGATQDTLIDGIRYLLERFTALGSVGINYRLLGKAQAKLNGLPISSCINGSSSASATETMSYIENELLSSFPMVSMVWGNGKYGPVVTDRRDGYFCANLEVGTFPLFDRISDVQESPKSSCYNSFTLRYNYDSLEDNFAKAITIDESNSALCQVSRMQMGNRPLSPIDSLTIQNDNIAAYVIEWLVQHMSFPSYYVEYQGAVWLFFNLDVGDNIRLTDPDFGWVEQVATVEKLEYQRGICTVGFRVWWRYYDLSGSSSTIFSYPTPEPTDVT